MERKFFAVIAGVIAVVTAVVLVVYSGLGYVAFHFIKKFW